MPPFNFIGGILMPLTITLDGKTYTAPKPKVKLWRQVTKFQEEITSKDTDEFLDGILGLIIDVFNNPEITPEVVEEHMELSELLPLFNSMVEWVNGVVMGRLNQIPNEETPANP